MTDQTVGQFRQFVRDISPSWLNGSISSRFMYSMATMFDALSDGASYAIRARFPSIAPPDALPWIQQDRGIDPGPNESSTSFIARLNLWLDLWRLAGTDFAILLALYAYLTPNQLAISVVSVAGTWTSYPTNGAAAITNPPTWTFVPGLWNWDGASDPFATWQWWRSWVIIYDIGGALGSPTITWGGGQKWGDGTTWGWSAPASTAVSLRGIVSKWRAAHCVVPNIIIGFSGSAPFYTPTSPASELPDGTWGHWGKVRIIGGVRTYVPARSPGNISPNQISIYIDGTP